MTPGTACLEKRIIWAKQRKRPEESEGKKHIRIHHWKRKQVSGISINNFCRRLSKEIIVKNFAIVVKKMTCVRWEKLCRDRSKQTDVNSKDSSACAKSIIISNNKKEKNDENINRKQINKEKTSILGTLHLYLILMLCY